MAKQSVFRQTPVVPLGQLAGLEHSQVHAPVLVAMQVGRDHIGMFDCNQGGTGINAGEIPTPFWTTGSNAQHKSKLSGIMKRAQTLDQRKWRVLNTQEAVAQVVCHALAGVTSREIRPLACGSDEKTMKIGGDLQRLVPYYLPVANRQPRRLTLPPKWNQLLWHEEFRFGLMPKCFLGCNEPVRSQKQLIQKRQMRAIW